MVVVVMAVVVVMVVALMVTMSANREERARALFRVRAGQLVDVGQELLERRPVQGAQLVLVRGLGVRLGGVWRRRCARGSSSHVPLRCPLRCFTCQPPSDHVALLAVLGGVVRHAGDFLDSVTQLGAAHDAGGAELCEPGSGFSIVLIALLESA